MNLLSEGRLYIVTLLDVIGGGFIVYLLITSCMVYVKIRRAMLGCEFSRLPYCFNDAIKHAFYGMGLSLLLLAIEVKWLLDSTLIYKYKLYTWHTDHVVLLGCLIYIIHWALWTLRSAYGRAQRGCQGDCTTCFDKAKSYRRG